MRVIGHWNNNPPLCQVHHSKLTETPGMLALLETQCLRAHQQGLLIQKLWGTDSGAQAGGTNLSQEVNTSQ